MVTIVLEIKRVRGFARCNLYSWDPASLPVYTYIYILLKTTLLTRRVSRIGLPQTELDNFDSNELPTDRRDPKVSGGDGDGELQKVAQFRPSSPAADSIDNLV